MALRVMQIFVPHGSGTSPDELLEGRDVLGRWHDEHKDQTVLHLLVPAEETEPIMDQFEQHFAAVEGVHVVLFPVEAVLPRPKIEEASDETEKEPAAGFLSLFSAIVEGSQTSRCFWLPFPFGWEEIPGGLVLPFRFRSPSPHAACCEIGLTQHRMAEDPFERLARKNR